jgi:hypothetical protein
MKNNLRTYGMFSFALFFIFSIRAQETPNPQILLELQQLSQQVLKENTDEIKDSLNTAFKKQLGLLLSEPNYYNYPFDELKTISRLTSNNKQVRIFNWHIPYTDGTFAYFAFVLKKNNTNNSVTLFELTDNKQNLNKIENTTLKKNNWFGAHYYDIIEVKNKKYSYYTLLGWDGNNLLSNRKVIDVLCFDKNNELLLGAPIFKTKQKLQKRFIFEYADEASMTLKYDEKENVIVFNHLTPLSSGLKDVKAYHVPDGSFDALKKEKGRWVFISDYDARLAKSIKDKFYKLDSPPKPNK